MTVATTADDFRRLYASAPVGLLTLTFEGEVSEVNDTFLAWTGLERDAIVGTSFRSHLDAGSQLFYETRQLPVLRLQGAVREVSLTLHCADDVTLPILLNAELQDIDGTPVVHVAVFDATSRLSYERDLLAARRAAEASESRVLVLQGATTELTQSHSEQDVADVLYRAAVTAFAPAATGVFLLNDGAFILTAGEHPLDGMIPADAPLASNSAIEDGAPLTVSARDESGSYPFVVAGLREKNLDSVTIIPLLRNGVPLGVLACFFAREYEFDELNVALIANLSRQAAQAFVRVRLQHELERLALHDQLTGLANRMLLQDTVTRAVETAIETGQPLSIVFLDLDGFKAVNDELGHVVGDLVLTAVADRLRSAVRLEDVVGRYGGDEFVAVCEAADELAALSIADRVRELVARPIEGIPSEFAITASVGIATYTPDVRERPSNDELLSLADTAMYQSKSSGKNRVTHVRR